MTGDDSVPESPAPSCNVSVKRYVPAAQGDVDRFGIFPRRAAQVDPHQIPSFRQAGNRTIRLIYVWFGPLTGPLVFPLRRHKDFIRPPKRLSSRPAIAQLKYVSTMELSQWFYRNGQTD